MSRLNTTSATANGFHAPQPPSSLIIASTVSTYMASIDARRPTPKMSQGGMNTTNNNSSSSTSNGAAGTGRKAKQKLKMNTHRSSLDASITAAATEQLKNRSSNFCRNPFCGALLESPFVKFCVKKSYCQLYRGLQLHCGSFVSERERAVDKALENLRKQKKRRLRKSSEKGGGDNSEEEEDEAEEKRKVAVSTAATAEFSIPKRKIPVASPTAAAISTESAELSKDELRAQRKLQRRIARQETAAASGGSGAQTSASAVPVEGSDGEKQNSKKRRLILDLRGDSAANAAIPQATTPPLPTAANASAQPKTAPPARPPTPVSTVPTVGGIEVIPLGAGRHPSSFGGGSRYVQSGNRAATNNLRVINPLARQPTVPAKPPMPADPIVPPLPPRGEPVDPRLQQRAPGTVPVVPPRTSASGPRRADFSAARFEVTPSSSPVVAQESQAQPTATSNRVGPPPTTAKRIISASEYLSSRKPQDPRVRPVPSGGDLPPSSGTQLQHSSSELTNTLVSSSFLNEAPPRGRTFSRSQSDSNVLHAFAGSRDSRDKSLPRHQSESSRKSTSDYIDLTSSGLRIPPRQNSADPSYSRSSSHDGASPYGRRDYDSRDDSFRSERSLPLPSRPYSPNRYNDHSYEPEYHRVSSLAFSQEPHWQRRQEDPTSRRSDEPPRAPLYGSSPSRDQSRDQGPPTPRIKTDHSVERATEQKARDVNVHPEILSVIFSSHDKFMVNLLSRFASFFPKALSPVLNKTKKPRKMRFYLDYVERVKQLSGSRLDVRVADGKGVVTVEGRDWLTLKGSSTVDLYTRILETLLEQGLAWRKLVDDSNRVYGNAVQRLRDRASRSESFLRMWQGMKFNSWKDFPTERQVTYFRGGKRHHWTFCVGNVEIGSGSHEEKNEAFRLAGEDAMKFLLSLEILNDNQKYSVDRRYEQSDRDAELSTQRSSLRDPLPPRSTGSRSSSTASRQLAAVAVAAPAPPVAEIVDTPEVTIARVRDDSFSSDADGTFSPVTQSEHSATEEDMEISSDGDRGDGAQKHPVPTSSSTSSNAPSNTSKKPKGCVFCDIVRLRDPDAKFCMRCKVKQQPQAVASGLQSSRNSSPRSGRESAGLLQRLPSSSRASVSDTLDLLQNGLPTRR